MALPSSGPLSLSDIQTEFGGSNPISLSEYYAGGSYVPAGTTGTYGAVPSSGAISIQNFYGTTNAVVNFTSTSVLSAQYAISSAIYTIQGTTASPYNIGNVYKTQNGSTSQYEQWVTPTSAAGNYEVYVTYSGDTPGGTFNSWVACSTNPQWGFTAFTPESFSATLSFQVRAIGTTTVLDSWTVDITATAF